MVLMKRGVVVELKPAVMGQAMLAAAVEVLVV